MFTRRQFLAHGPVAAALGLSGAAFAQDEARPKEEAKGKSKVPAENQRMVDAGLAYLAQQQLAQKGVLGTGGYTGNVAINSLAGLAMMAGGHQPGRGKYGKVVSTALEYILQQEENSRTSRTPGYIVARGGGHGGMYGHGFATLFLAEAYGTVRTGELRKRLKNSLTRAVQLIVSSQNQEGGWRYEPQRNDADLSVTICQIMALRAARNAGILVPATTVKTCTQYVRLCQERLDGRFRYQARGGHSSFALTAAGIVALYSAGIYKGEEIDKALKYLDGYRPNAQGGARFDHFGLNYYFYGHYYAAQAMWTAGGEYWDNWYKAISGALQQRFQLAPRRQGEPETGFWTDNVSPHFATSMACIILQIPHCYLPILQK